MGRSHSSLGSSSGELDNKGQAGRGAFQYDFIFTPDMVERCWNDQEASNQFELPWEAGIWKQIFSDKFESLERVCKFHRLPPVPMPQLSDDVAEPSSKRLKSAGPSHWLQVVTNTDIKTWKEDMESKLATSLNRWFDVIIQFPATFSTVQQLGALKSLPDQMRMLRDVLADKSPLTLMKRANSMLRYVEFLRKQNVTVPGSEEWLYKFLCDERHNGSPASRLQAVVEALRFTEHVFGIEDLGTKLLSKRGLGAAKSGPKPEKIQAAPLTVLQLTALHEVLHDESADFWDRLVAGAILLAVYSRSRWADLQHTDSVEFDPDDKSPVYVELKIKEFKTKKANAWRGGILTAVAPALGVVKGEWVSTWWMLRSALDAPLASGFPVMPAPDESGVATLRPLGSGELGKWLKLLMDRRGLVDEARRLSSHSSKATLLSYLAKWGADIPTREILGGHSSRLKTVLTYSRDSLGAPLRTLDSMLGQIRSGSFRPDELRSGRFVEEVMGGDQDQDDPKTIQCKLEVVSVEETEVNQEDGNLDSSSSEDTSSSSDEDAATNSHAARMVNAPKAPDGTSLRQHQKSRCCICSKMGMSTCSCVAEVAQGLIAHRRSCVGTRHVAVDVGVLPM